MYFLEGPQDRPRLQALTQGSKMASTGLCAVPGKQQRAIWELRRHKGVKQYVLIDNLVHFCSGVSPKSRQPIRDFYEGKGDKKA
jgi:hypothetical protein